MCNVNVCKEIYRRVFENFPINKKNRRKKKYVDGLESNLLENLSSHFEG